MPKRFYIATRKDRETHANAIANALHARGWQRTYTWTAQEPGSKDQHATIALEELEAVRTADVLFVLLPGGYGTHVEIGAALALDKPVIIHAPDRKTLETPYPCVFHYHPGVKLIVSETIDVEVILAALQ